MYIQRVRKESRIGWRARENKENISLGYIKNKIFIDCCYWISSSYLYDAYSHRILAHSSFNGPNKGSDFYGPVWRCRIYYYSGRTRHRTESFAQNQIVEYFILKEVGGRVEYLTNNRSSRCWQPTGGWVMVRIWGLLRFYYELIYYYFGNDWQRNEPPCLAHRFSSFDEQGEVIGNEFEICDK